MRLCKLEGCGLKHMGHGYCKKHYRSNKKYGDPLVGIGHGTHLLSSRSEYAAWRNMKSRCLNPKFTAYEFYGGRGITVYEGWIKNFAAFYEHVGPKPTPKHTLDRKDSNKGYEPGNVRWVTMEVQGINQRLKKTNKSGYRGVSYNAGKYHKKRPWYAQITSNNKHYHLGHFGTAEQAALAYNQAASLYHGEEAKLNVIT